MEKYFNSQKDVQSKIIKAHVNFKKSSKERLASIDYIQTRLDGLQQLWDRFIKGHQLIIDNVEDWSKFETSDYMKSEMYESTEDSYTAYKLDLLKYKPSKTQSCSTNSQSTNNGFTSSIKLPKISIPTFSGRYEEWITFRDMFLSLIHSNESLDDVQRLHYLKGHLTGEAEQLIRQLPITAGNYEECWNQLLARYDNKIYLANNILKRLIYQKSSAKESSVHLRTLCDTTADCLHALRNIGVDISSWDIIVIYLVSQKLDADTRKQWELRVADEKSRELPKLSQFKDFLESRFRALESIESNQSRPPTLTQNLQRHKVLHASVAICEFCGNSHKTFTCKELLAVNVDKRREFVIDKRLCFNCLGSNHSARFCPIKICCQVCNGKHHSVLHTSGLGHGSVVHKHTVAYTAGVGSESSVEKSAGSPVDDAPVVSCLGKESNKRRQVFLATAVVVADSNKRQRYVRALLDQGSQANFVTEATVQSLRMQKRPIHGRILGLGSQNSTVSKYTVEFDIKSRLDKSVNIRVEAYVLKTITTVLPNYQVEELDWGRDMVWADPQYYVPSKIDILLGAEIYGQVLQSGIRKGPTGQPLAQATSLGWILSGGSELGPTSSTAVVAMHICIEDDNEMLKKFWEIEAEPKSSKKIMSEEESRCEQFFADTTKRDSDGRYVVKLPFKTDRPACVDGDTRVVAERRLHGLQKRFKKNKKLSEMYTKVIQEYLQLGFLEKIPETEKEMKLAVYLPHHGVLREDKDTTKLRVVYDASCKYKNGISLNDELMVGPTLQPELRNLLMRWRLHPICLSADIIKMYCQVKVAKEDTDFQRLLWSEDGNTQLEDYRLLRVTFGTASAPYLAVKSLQQLSHDEGTEHPAVSERVINDYYMDDLLTGCNTVEEGVVIYQEMKDLLSKGGFQLQKWMSNNDKLLEAIRNTTDSNEDINEELRLKNDEIVKLLGLKWNRRTDGFHYSVTPLDLEPGPVTKRKIISHISRLYDPLGWAAPCVIIAKIIIQKLWISGIGWDDEVSDKLLKEWNTYRNELHVLTQVNIPRWLGTNPNDSFVELHGFSDASKLAYSAAVYLRRVDAAGTVRVALVTAKTKVAPIKQISIPRLELCGAVLVTRLLVEVAETLKITDRTNIRAWTDSAVVLAWINSHPSRWQTFVGNRVSEILSTLDSHQWSHISSGQNPADCASRGITPTELLNNKLWFNGPDMLWKEHIQYHKPTNIETRLEEIKVLLAVPVSKNKDEPELEILERYSSLTKLVRVIAYCRRFLNLLMPIQERRGTYLSSKELSLALQVCIKLGQHMFRLEMSTYRTQGKWIKLKGPLRSLNPFLDSNGLLRVGGRLEKSTLKDDAKHPILLPKKSALTDLIIKDAHARTLHGGIQLMLTYLGTKYFIFGVKSLVKACVHKCVTCVRYKAKTSQPFMGQLPTARVTPARAFESSGVDYAGPINVRTTKGRGHHSYKGYICLFICMATRAVHLEVVSDLTTQGFLAAFKRFVARRGHCTDLWSDNGTNFVGASRELKQLFAAEKSEFLAEISEVLATNGTTWHWIPPHSPNFGGLWEAGIKSTKFHLKRTIGETTLTYEELATVLAQIEACLNSRPLARLDSDSDGVDALTPGHFLVGGPLITAPDQNYETANLSGLRRWQLTQKMLQDFWKRWYHEYLTKFLHRYRWSDQNPEPGLGDVVLVKEENLPPCRWLLGRVVEKHPGIDHITRVLSIKTKGGVIKRPVSKICVLPLAD